MMIEQLGDQPIEPEQRVVMQKIGSLIDSAINYANPGQKRWGFCLMVFPFENFDGRANYISSAQRADVIALLKEQLRRFEGAPDAEGHAR